MNTLNINKTIKKISNNEIKGLSLKTIIKKLDFLRKAVIIQ